MKLHTLTLAPHSYALLITAIVSCSGTLFVLQATINCGMRLTTPGHPAMLASFLGLQITVNRVVSCPAPPRTCEKGGSGVLNDFSCHSSAIRELKSDYRTSSSTRSSIPAVRCTRMGNAIITFFTPFEPAPIDKKCHSEHQTSFRFSGEGSGDETINRVDGLCRMTSGGCLEDS